MSARREALRVLGDVLDKGAYLNLALKNVDLERGDMRFATALVSTTLENLQHIDFVLSQFINVKKTEALALNVLRLGVCQLMYMDSVPDSAAVNESVKLIKTPRPSQRGFVNGVLRNVIRKKDDIQWPSPEEDFTRYLSVTYSYPEWICNLVCEQYGKEQARKILAYTGNPGRTCLRRTDLCALEDVIEPSVPGIYLDDALYALGASNLSENTLLEKGAYTVQSEASMLCVRALGLTKDANVLDLCAAPGGKSAYAAQIAKNGHVTACDLHEHRVELIENTVKRLQADNITARQWDATMFNPEWKDAFDFVLVDAPCSALGLLYRKPDIKASKRPEDLDALVDTQKKILACAREYVRPGGVLVYSTCTIDKKENEQIAEWFLRENPSFQARGLAENFPGALQDDAVSGMIQLLPDKNEVDGFFISRFEREKATV